MGARDLGQQLAPASAIQAYLDTHAHAHAPTAQSPHATELHHLAIQIAHNLRYQHLWTDVCLHTHSALAARPLPRPMISGVPPQRLYVHPDEQIELLQQQKDEGKSGTGMPELSREREWVLPSHLREKWSLRRFGETFNSLTVVPPPPPPPPSTPTPAGDSDELNYDFAHVPDHLEPSKWRTSLPKRLLLATLDDDSTVVYYIVHDGLVKPRQN
ncbi:uncharacterized protein MYCFIDRAFT_148505 [Pseudocercospora fijiensis CIRAD86]|uniref:tRNA-splicing endonuclease subunit Sen15 domain-containing protein n=1 Tax=Pseudocercospora fijiensis (strain CIRAD86) TaxID=383855 RepID=N1QAD9_PSEFD|nr:uncharacterized protein MYCFIDRAFT_148505 [Pseudocercospora fijiensis CIRAD86]EME87887.1 hypothetical protein MYCFIDRAFT_148505 [Pseudocercospora fijiensis CIRAD86]